MNDNIRITALVMVITAAAVIAAVMAIPAASTALPAAAPPASIEDSTTVPQAVMHTAITTDTESEKPFVAPPAPDEGSLEVRVFRLLNSKAATPVLDVIMPLVTDFRRNRIVLFVVWAMLVLFGGNRGRWAALMLIPLVAATDQLSASVIKPLVGRSRPCEVLGSVHMWYGPEGWITTPAEVIRSYKSSFSFPSSHATNITGAMLFLGLTFRKVLWPMLFTAVLVSWSRVYIGVHWTSDVIVGMALGALLGWLAWIAFKRIYSSLDRTGSGGGSDDQDGTDGLLDDPGRSGPE
ncbi:MAG: phosphatase PAP2 family protein [Candidatus Krumholzibacteria bacterium]|nr:phosphatase PAP2 family protein [Candidatus Krumholzibacteria bacterium]